MTFMEIAQELVAGCREGRENENLGKLYAEDAVSVEAADMGGTGRETRGLEGIRGKHAWWDSTFETLEAKVTGPYWHGEESFAVLFEVKTRNKESGEVDDMHEIGVYHVADGKIVREEFFYPLEEAPK
ncbi:SnoaL-like domain-containing protein [Pseudaestuariivita sp.]|uniref:SnoaL-like domain-containing protein n=1 Tax=Pseudaestuariivita sp. TaxID=2211669 RepID=UPI00405997C8